MSNRFLLSVVLMVVFALLPRCFAKDLGAFGTTYPITEENFLTFIQKRVQSMDTVLLQQGMQKRATRYRDRPPALQGLTRATKTKRWVFDPSVVLSHAITTETGVELIPKGTRINPLTTHRLSKALLFLNADDKDQRAWALALDKQLQGKDKIILVGGSLLSTEKLWGRAVYFDQGGRLTAHFGIKHTPAWITQQKKELLITEVAL